MNFKYIAKKIAAVCMIGSLSVGSLTGCGQNTQIVFTTGLSGDEIFKIGSAVCTEPELMIYLITFYNQYADTYGPEMWEYDFGGISLEDNVKDVVLSKMTQIKIMNLMAEERNIRLTDQETQKVQEAATHYYEKLEKKLKDREDITEKVVQTVYQEYAIANKVYETITESADMEISDDEARTVTVQEIYLKTWKLKNNEKVSMSEEEKDAVKNRAEKLLERLKEGEDFETLAAAESEDHQLVQSYAREMAEPELESVLFSLDEGEISGVIETADGYYIEKCISTMDYEATQENKLVLAEQRKKEAFSEAYAEIANHTHSQFRDKRWKRLTMEPEIHRTEADFFDIYEEYVKE